MRTFSLCALMLMLAACQSVNSQFPKPAIPHGASLEEETRIYCHQSPASPWYIPCDRGSGR